MAPIPANCVRCSLVWSPGSGWPAESAVNTFHLVPQDATGVGTVDPQWIADSIAPLLVSHWADLSPQISSQAQVTALKTWLLDTSNRAIAAGVHAFSPGALAGGSSANMMPPECAICLSQYAYPPGGFTANKGRKRGRMYIPYWTQSALQANGKVVESVASAHAQAWAAFIEAVNGVVAHEGSSNPMGWVILSVAAGVPYEVIHVSVDDHWDAQRRRQRQDTPVQHVFDVANWA